jgi:hypothetical protein
MSVNPNLAAIMRVIEDHQDKMPEGEYLEAMNALGALHRQEEQRGQVGPNQAAMINIRPPPSYAASGHLFASPARVFPPGMESLTEQRAWERVKNNHPEPFWNSISPEEWIVLSYETRYELLREATENCVDKRESHLQNPDPKLYPFISRHAFGLWGFGDDDNIGECRWECMCGYTGKVKNWQKHEQSERHQDWAKHRTVSRRKIQKMMSMIQDDEAGEFIRFATYGSPDHIYPGGIRFYTSTQERNEWTHPELYTEFHRSPIPTKDGVGTWFVHQRNIWARQYVQ